MATSNEIVAPHDSSESDSDSSSDSSLDEDRAAKQENSQIHLICFVCKKVSGDKKQLQEHAENHYKKFHYPCVFCPKVFLYEDRIKEHENTVHMSNVNAVIQCKKCMKYFGSDKSLTCHMRMHNQTLSPKKSPVKNQTPKCQNMTYNNTSPVKQEDSDSSVDLEVSINPNSIMFDYVPNDRFKNEQMDLDEDYDLNYLISTVKSPKVVLQRCDDLCSRETFLNNVPKSRMNEFWVCHVCKSYVNKKIVRHDHVMKHYRDFYFPCAYCSDVFKFQTELFKHQFIHSDYMPYSCKICLKKYKREPILMRHLLTHSESDKPVSPTPQAKKDVKPKKDEVLIKQEVKANPTKGFVALDVPAIQKQPKKANFHCTKCETKFSRYSLLSRHLMTHEVPSTDVGLTAQSKMNFRCNKCDAKFPKYNLLMKHQATHPISLKIIARSHNCEICRKKFVNSASLEKHKAVHEIQTRAVHEVQLKKEVPKSNLCCGQCKQLFSNLASLTKHQLAHKAQENSFLCVICSIEIGDPEAYDEHLKKHDEGIENILANSSPPEPAIVKHSTPKQIRVTSPKQIRVTSPQQIRVTSPQQMHVTSPKQIHVSPSVLQKSQSNGTSPKLFLVNENWYCRFCKAKVGHREDLRDHMRTHFKKNHFPCGFCPIVFDHSLKLENHEVSHFGRVIRFECHLCKKRYSNESNLVSHMKVHLDVSHYNCQFCPLSFNTHNEFVGHNHQFHAAQCDWLNPEFLLKVNNIKAIGLVPKKNGNNDADHQIDISDEVTQQTLTNELPAMNGLTPIAVNNGNNGNNDTIKHSTPIAQPKPEFHRCIYCTQCKAPPVYKHLKTLNRHIKIKHPEVNVIAPLGRPRLSNISKVNEVPKNNTNSTPPIEIVPTSKPVADFECGYCPARLATLSDLKDHVMSHPNDAILPTDMLSMEMTVGESDLDIEEYMSLRLSSTSSSESSSSSDSSDLKPTKYVSFH